MPRPPNYEFQEWWNKQQIEIHNNVNHNHNHNHNQNHTITSSSSTSNVENPNFVSVAISASDSLSSPLNRKDHRNRTRSARQLSFFCFLKLQHFLHFIFSIFTSFFSLLRTANRRIAKSRLLPNRRTSDSRFFRLIKFLLVVVVLLLCVELIAYFKGWHFSPPSLRKTEVLGFVELVYASWLRVRAEYLAPPLQSLSNVCIILFLVQSVDRAVLMLGCFWIKCRGIKPVAVMEYSSKSEDHNVEDFPMVLVQIPMCNEREVR